MISSTPRGVLALTSIASFMVALDLLVVSTAFTTIRLELHATIQQAQWTVTAYGLSFAGLLMTGAALGDRCGRRRMFTIGLAVFAAASAGCALAPTIGWLVAARAIQGAGAALIMPLAVTLISAAVPAASRGRALGALEGLTGLATIAGPPLGGTVAQLVGWQAIFWVNVPIAVAVMALCTRWLREDYGSEKALDAGGLILVSLGALGLVWGLVTGNDSGWATAPVVAALAGGLTLLAAFVGWQHRTTAPMLPLALFRSRGFSMGTAASVLLSAALYGSVLFLAQFMQVGLGYTPAEAGLRLMAWTAALLVVAPLAGALADRVGDRPVLVAGLALNAVGLAWIGWIASPDLGYPSLVAPLVVAGVGASMAIPVVQNTVLGGVAPGWLGKASGANTMTQELGGALGVALLVAVFTASGAYGSPQQFLNGFVPAIGLAAGLVLAAAVVALAVPRQPASPTSPGHQGSDPAAPPEPTAEPARLDPTSRLARTSSPIPARTSPTATPSPAGS